MNESITDLQVSFDWEVYTTFVKKLSSFSTIQSCVVEHYLNYRIIKPIIKIIR